MKRKLFLLTGIIFVLLSGCGKEKNLNPGIWNYLECILL